MKTALLGLRAETSLHAGAGKAVGVIDLPIMREAHTRWPVVFGSAVKGAMRAKAEQVPLPELELVFGPDTRHASDHAGALAVGDARLLLLPVRSLTTHFKWVTCPALLDRAAADAKRMGFKAHGFKPASSLQEDQAITHSHTGGLFLEEFHFTVKNQDLTLLINWLAAFVGDDFKPLLQQQLVIVSDDVFAHLAEYATPVTPHIAIEKETKTVKDGALWYEETLPPDTILYVCLGVEASRKPGSNRDASAMLQATLGLFPADKPYLQLGGNETVGMGWCRVQPVNPGA